jgi:signal transduction histidine kinase
MSTTTARNPRTPYQASPDKARRAFRPTINRNHPRCRLPPPPGLRSTAINQLTDLVSWTQSIRLRSAAGAALVVAVALVASAFVVPFLQERALRSNLDATLEQRADDLAALIQNGSLPELLNNGRGDEAWVQIRDADGLLVTASPNAAHIPAMLPGFHPDGREFRTYDILPIDDDVFRVVGETHRFDDVEYTVLIGASLDPTLESVATLRRILLFGAPLLAAVVAWVTWSFVGRALQPVDAMRAQAAAISSTELDRRLPEPRHNDEIGRLARTMNQMLERLETAQRQQREFVSDASHELRSPLTAIRAQIEVDLTHPDRADPFATERSVLEETDRLERITDDLLQLARGDTERPARTATVEFDDVVFEETERLRSWARVFVDTVTVSAARITGDRDELARAVRNLLDNAVRHAHELVRIDLTEDPRTGDAVLRIADDGPGIPPDDRERIFARFTRLDEARARHSGGAGLGLAITRDIVTRHGGEVFVDPTYTEGARFIVRLPLAARPHLARVS